MWIKIQGVVTVDEKVKLVHDYTFGYSLIPLIDDHLRVCDTKDDHVFCLLHFRKKEESVKHL